MKKIISILLLTISLQALANVYVRFSPEEGQVAFQDIFTRINQAKKTISLTIYSWSHRSLMPALKEALENDVEIRIVLHPKLVKKSSVKKNIAILKELGAKIKVSTKDMHEKFMIVDGLFLLNTSANFSMGAQNNYSENFVFHQNNGEKHIKNIISQFENEFEVLWNYSKSLDNDLYKDTSARITDKLVHRSHKLSNLNTLFSSSFNFNQSVRKNNKNSRYLNLKLKSKDSWVVRDQIIKQLGNAKKTVSLNINHFFIKEIADKLIEIHKSKNIKIKLLVDNQEFNLSKKAREVTPYFVKRWQEEFKKEEIPVRIKFYSIRPSYRFWKLNHHKYILIDSETDNPILINGSYNLSKKAEQGQFDNMVVYSGEYYKELVSKFKKEFNKLWFLKRDNLDKPMKSVLDYFLTVKNKDLYPIHNKVSVSMTWSELVGWFKSYRKKLNLRFIPIYSNKKHCMLYNPKTKRLFGCPSF